MVVPRIDACPSTVCGKSRKQQKKYKNFTDRKDRNIPRRWSKDRSGEEVPRGHCRCTGTSDTDPKEVGAAAAWVRMPDKEHLGVFNPSGKRWRQNRFPQEERRQGRKTKRREECHRRAPQKENAVKETSRAPPEQREQRTTERKGEADRPTMFWEERSPVRYGLSLKRVTGRGSRMGTRR
ncbi:hypothetical protein NDU88_002030 [Pleurodeles waltl]|uniref:Uncharacterized protein n=1 Tax=Pleurodeles waltl TaxID=8319 RepID=A0AAV7U9A9_PLEWA|nr:hypothetical protein NDU88_002030 [Pleurodeles waltl]